MSAPVLSVRDIVLTFGGIKALNGVSFDVEPGETFGVIGPNGAGKTALLNCVSGVYRPASGSICFHGDPITGLSPNRVSAKGISRTFQNTEQFHRFTVLDYVLLGRLHQLRGSVVLSLLAWPMMERAERRERHRALGLLERLGLAEHARAELRELPYGVQKRVDIARALAGEPRLLLLDEPTSGTVTGERAEVSEALRLVAAEGVPTVLVDHDVDFVSRHCARVLVVSYGTQIGIGEPAQMLAHPDVVEAFVGTVNRPQ